MLTWTLLMWLCSAHGCRPLPVDQLHGMTAQECRDIRRSFMATMDGDDDRWPEVKCEPEVKS